MPRRRDRVDYPATTSALGNPYNAERVALGIARADFGELSEREKNIVIETSRVFSGRIADLEEETQRLAEIVLELQRFIDTTATDGE